MTDEQLAEIRARWSGADDSFPEHGDRDIAALLAEVDRLRKAIGPIGKEVW